MKNIRLHVSVGAALLSAVTLATSPCEAAPLKVAITFDDGLKDQFDLARPLLEQYRYPATYNIVTDTIETDSRHMTWEDLKWLYRSGNEIVTHTCSHPSLPKLLAEGKDEAFRHEIVDSAKKLEERIGGKVTHVCAPGNNVNAAVVARLKELGYELQETNRPNLGGDFCAKEVDAYLADAIREGRPRCALMMHAIAGGGYRPFPNGAKDFEEVLKVLRRREKAGEIVVVPYNEAYPSAAEAARAATGLTLGTPFSDGAVLQRGRKVPVWGTAPAGAEVTVSFAGQVKTAKADAKGAWRVDLDPLEASSESRDLMVEEVRSKSEEGRSADVSSLTLHDVLVGEVWFASGQSNMDCPLWRGGHVRYRDSKGAMMTAMTRLPLVRYVKNASVWSVEPKPLKAQWRKMTPENLAACQLSAVAFYYARELYLALGVPIGIVDSSWGGSNIDAWTPRVGYADCDESIRATADYPVKGDDWNKETDKKGPIGGFIHQPTVLFNGMVASWTPMAMRGFIWYQGCHNAGEANLYCAKMHALYNGWSRTFENPDLRLYFAQLAPYTQNWCGIAEAQNRFAAEEPNAAIAVTADVGNFWDIHPNDKETVAQRLAFQALRRDYGFDIPDTDSPVVRSVAYSNDVATVTFDHARSLYVYSPDKSRKPAFELAGTNGVWAAAEIVNFRKKQGEAWADEFCIDAPFVELRSEKVPQPIKVRYMGERKTSGTVYNEFALPLGTFER